MLLKTESKLYFKYTYDLENQTIFVMMKKGLSHNKKISRFLRGLNSKYEEDFDSLNCFKRGLFYYHEK